MRPFFLVLLLSACAAPAGRDGAVPPTARVLDGAPSLSRMRLPLAEALPAGIDAVVLTVDDADGELTRLDLAAPFEAEVVIELAPGPQRRVSLLASINTLPAYMGTSAPIDVVEGEVVDAEIVIDPVGLLVVRPLALDLGLVRVRAVPRAPPAGLPAAYDLAAGDGGFTAVVPAGTYDLEFDLGALDLLPAAATTIEVLPGVRNEWIEPFVAPDVPLPLPGAAVRLDVEVPGGRLLTGLLGITNDVVVRARDAEGRLATGYRGTVRFDVVGALAVLLPAPHTFTEADAGEHRFGGLQVPLALLGGVLELVVRDDGGLETTVALDVVAGD